MSAYRRVRTIVERTLDRLVDATVLERVVIALAALLLSLIIGSVIVFVAGYDPITFIVYLIYGSIGTVSNIALMLRQATMLILAGVAVAIAFRAGIFNIGVQGQMVTGAFATATVVLGVAPHLPRGVIGGLIVMTIGLLAGIVAGGLYAALPGVMKAYADANEVVTTIMLNFIATGVVFYLLTNYMNQEGTSAPVTPDFPTYPFPKVTLPGSSFPLVALLVALVTVVLSYVLVQYTTFGYDLRTSGRQEPAAAFSGVNPERTIVYTMVLSGMVAGLTGAVFVTTVLGFYRDPAAFPPFGFDGIAVSLLAANNPLGVVPAGLLFGALSSAKTVVDIQLNIPKELVDGIVGLIVLFVAMPEFFRMSYQRYGQFRAGTSESDDEDGDA